MVRFEEISKVRQEMMSEYFSVVPLNEEKDEQSVGLFCEGVHLLGQFFNHREKPRAQMQLQCQVGAH